MYESFLNSMCDVHDFDLDISPWTYSYGIDPCPFVVSGEGRIYKYPVSIVFLIDQLYS